MSTTQSTVVGAAAAATLSILAASSAQAQAIKPVLPDFTDELGIRVGSFILRPSAEVGLEFNDNIFQAQDDTESDFILRTAPELKAESDWNRHAVRLSVGGAYGAYFENTEDNYLDAWASAQGVYDISRAASARLTLRGDQEHERRGDVDSNAAANEPIVFRHYQAALDGRYKPNRIRLSPFVEYHYFDFDDVDLNNGGEQNNDDRDRSQVVGGLEVGYSFLRGYEAFVRLQADMIEYEDQFDDGGFERSSVGAKALSGVRIDLTRLITADLGVGIVTRDYDDARLDELTGFTADATATWSVTPLTTIVIGASREIEETTFGNSPGRFVTEGEVEVIHSLRRDILVSAFTSVADRDFEAGGRQDFTVSAGVGAEWVLNRNLSVEGRYQFTRRDGDFRGGDFSQNQVFLGLSTKY